MVSLFSTLFYGVDTQSYFFKNTVMTPKHFFLHSIRVTFVLFIVSIVPTASVVAQGIKWQNGSFEDVIKTSKKQHKIIFLDVYATWCGPCKLMDSQVFADSTIGKIFNTQFINAKIDGETVEGKQLVEQFELNSYPSRLFITENWEVLSKQEGTSSITNLLKIAATVTERSKSNSSNDELEERYLRGNREPAFLYVYLKSRQLMSLENGHVLNQYLTAITPSEQVLPTTLTLILENADILSGKAFDIIIAHKNDSVFNRKIKALLNFNFNKAVNLKSEQLLNDVLIANGKLYSTFSEVNAINTETKINYFDLTKQYNAFFETTDFWYNSYFLKKDIITFQNSIGLKSVYAKKLQHAAEIVANVFNEPTKLEKSIIWIRKSIELEEKYTNVNIYSRLMYILGNKNEAIVLKKRALLLAKQEAVSKDEIVLLEQELLKIQ